MSGNIMSRTNTNKTHVQCGMRKLVWGVGIHTSISRGVTISKFGDEYWTMRYWRSVRISS